MGHLNWMTWKTSWDRFKEKLTKITTAKQKSNSKEANICIF